MKGFGQMDAIAGLLFLGAIILLIMTIIGAIKKNGKAKKRFLTAVICFVLAVIAIQFTDSGKEARKKAEEEQAKKEKSEQVEKEAEARKTNTEEKENKIEKENKEVASYKIVQERLDSAGIWYVTISTPATKEDELTGLVKQFKGLAENKKEKISSVFVNIQKENGSSALIGKGKIALNNKGVAQTGVEKIGAVNFEYLPENIEDKAPIEESKSKYTANDVLQAFKDANLAVPENRDNTSKQCSDLGCSQLITTEAVSIYQWPTEKKAKEIQNQDFGDYQKGTFIIRFNDKSVEQEPYKRILDEFKNGETEIEDKKEAKEEKSKEDKHQEASINVEDVKQDIEYSGLGANDKLVGVTFKNGEIKGTIELAENNLIEPKDQAVTGYSQLSDSLLKKEGWDTLTIEYVNVGTISMKRSEKETNEVGDYFPSIEIEKKLTAN